MMTMIMMIMKINTSLYYNKHLKHLLWSPKTNRNPKSIIVGRDMKSYLCLEIGLHKVETSIIPALWKLEEFW